MSPFASEALLCVDGLSASYRVGGGHLSVVRGLSFVIQRGRVIALLGESGGGKTTAIQAMLGLLPAGSEVEGSVRFLGTELIGAPEDSMRAIRGARISCIPQEPWLSLNPVIRVIDQVAMVVQAHQRLRTAKCRERARAALEQAGLRESQLHNSYAHQLSGGQRQRVVIAQAIVNHPSLVIADEPTGSLDAPSAREILAHLLGWVQQMGASLLLITHDPSVAGYIADRVMVMYAGRIVEEGTTNEVLQEPLHPYTQGLLRCMLDLPHDGAGLRDRHIAVIDGMPPDFHQLSLGCMFQPRCPDRMPICAESEPPAAWSGSRQARCFLYGPPR